MDLGGNQLIARTVLMYLVIEMKVMKLNLIIRPLLQNKANHPFTGQVCYNKIRCVLIFMCMCNKVNSLNTGSSLNQLAKELQKGCY